jgi:hypothetical protein
LSKAPKAAFVLALCLAASLPHGASAQQVQVGDNVNVLPVVNSGDPNDYLRGDLYGQRQQEPNVVVSSVNKDHVLAFYNDFRAVDIAADEPLPGLLSSTSGGRLWNGLRGLVARLLGRPPARRSAVAAREAGIGMSVSYDGGLTWTGGFMPGLPFDTTPGSVKSPGFGLEGMSDPVAVAAPCGRFYVAYLAFSRATGTSKLLVARFQDLNDHDVRHTIKYLGTSLLATGQAPPFTIMTGGGPPPSTFVDKPEIALKLTGMSSCSDVTEHVYVTFTKFIGQGSAGSFQSEIHFAKSTDLGKYWSTSRINGTYQASQGTALAVHPMTGLASVFWRSFNTPDTIVMRRSTSSGGWSTPVDLLKGDSLKTLAKFDQPSVSTQEVSDKTDLAFRTNAFPDAAITPDGSLMIVVWHERVNGSGDPDPAGSPRIVWKYSKDGGTNWSSRKAIANARPASPPGLGFFNPSSAPAAGPQVMPSVTCGAGTPNRCVVTYYESRDGSLTSNGWIGGYDRILDLRAVVIDANADPAPQPSFQVSRYDYRPLLANETPQEALSYVQPVCPSEDESHCYPALNYSGRPHTSSGTEPFMGDYNAVTPFEQYVKDQTSGKWRLAKSAVDVPGGARFLAAWADNRNVVVAAPGDGTEWQNFGQYGAAGTGGPCTNPGSRDQNVMTAHISTGLLVSAPTNFKPFQAPLIEFPMTVWNNTGADRQFDLDLVGNGSFAKEPGGDPPYPFPLKDGGVTVFPYSSASVNVYAFDGSPVTVNVTECTLNGCAAVSSPLTGSITFNAPTAAPPGGAPAFTYESSAIAANPVPRNPVPRNPVPKNPVPRNAVSGDVHDIIDYSWTVSPTSQGDAGTYVAFANVDRAYANDYVFQLFVTKPSTLFTAEDCEPANLALGTLVGHISDPANPVPRNPVPRNPVPRNPVPRNAPPSDQLVQNTSFTLESSESVSSLSAFSMSGGGGGPCDSTSGAGLIGVCTMAAPRPANEVTITLRAYQVTANPTVIYDPHGDITGTATPPSVTVADYWCTSADEGCSFTRSGPDLAVPDPPADPATNVTPMTVPAGQTVTFPVTSATIVNAGTETADEHRVGYYVSAASTIATLPRTADGVIDTESSTYTRLLDSVNVPALAAGQNATVDPRALTIPADIPRPNNDEGVYFLYAYVDDLRLVNELDEDNDIIQGGPITVQAPPSSLSLGPATLWIGLQNSDDQGTQVDLRTELYVGTTRVAAGETRCITGVTRNPGLARGVSVPFGSIEGGASGAISLKVLTRIGTNPDDTKCSGPGGSHNNARGVRLYYDATSRPSRFGAQIPPATSLTPLFLHNTGSSFFLDSTPPTAISAKSADSAGIDFNGGNPWKEIGTWTRP